MSVYATQADLVDRFGEDELVQLTDRASTGAVNGAVVDKALTDADAEINSYLASRYQLPLQDAPQVLNRLACDMARYYLHDERATEQVRDRYRDAVKFLRDIADGKASLGIVPPQEAPSVSGGPAFDTPGRTFTRQGLGDY